MKVRDLLEDAHARERNLSELIVVFEHEGQQHEVGQFDILCGKLVLKPWPIPLGASARAR